LGSAIIRQLAGENCDIITSERDQVDLREQAETRRFLASAGADAVVLCAASVGGINANIARPAEFIFDNLAIQTNVIDGAHRAGVNRLVFLGSSCMYPRASAQPIREEALMQGPLEPTNEPYAFAKLAGLAMVQAYRRQYGRSYITLVPTNLYGPGDHFLTGDGHVVAAMIDRFHRAKLAVGDASPIWGTGRARREFLFVDDAAEAIVRLLKTYDEASPINIAGGENLSILQLAHLVAQVVGYEGPIECDATKPDGMPMKGLDGRRLHAMGWHPKVRLRAGLERTYADYLDKVGAART